MTIFIYILIGAYLGLGIAYGAIHCFLAVLGNSLGELLLGFTAPLTWPVLLLRMFIERR